MLLYSNPDDAYASALFDDIKVTILNPIHPQYSSRSKETADIDESNNNWPVKEMPSRFQVFKKHKAVFEI